ncbi:MAG: tripartite tricarboxylate transporter substrate binding protein [Thermodesulfobacteriota bacterium]
MLNRILAICFIVFFAVLFITIVPAIAKWPSEPIKIIIPWPPANDPSTLVTTAMVPLMQKELGVPVKIINKPGGAGVLGTNELAQVRPDGHTMGLISIGPMLTQPIRGVTPYKTDDFKTLGLIWSSPFTLACRADAPYKNLKELTEYGKTHPLKLAHWGLGAVPTLIAMNVAKIGGFKWQETAYKELNPLLVTSGDADVITFSIPGLRDYISSGKMRLLACMLPNRLPAYPDVPTVSEQGFGDAHFIWFGIFVPVQTPDDVAKRLSEVFFKVMGTSEIQEVIKKVGVVPIPVPMERAKAQIKSELVKFRALMDEFGLIKK